MTRSRLGLVAAFLGLVAATGGCAQVVDETRQRIDLESWLAKEHDIAAKSFTKERSTTRGGPSTWRVDITLRQGTPEQRVFDIAHAGDRVIFDQQSYLVVRSDHLRFWARRGHDYSTLRTGEPAAIALRRALPSADIDMSTRITRAQVPGCTDPWESLLAIDLAAVAGHGPLEVACGPRTVALWDLTTERRTLTDLTADRLAATRARIADVVARTDAEQGWTARYAEGRGFQLEVPSKVATNGPDRAMLARSNVRLVTLVGASRGCATGEVDTRAPVQELIDAGLEADGCLPFMSVRGPRDGLSNAAAVADRYRDLDWQYSIPREGVELRARGPEFAVRCRQAEAILEQGVRFTVLRLVPRNGVMTLEAASDEPDLDKVFRAIRAGRWEGELRISYQRMTPEVFWSTATGKARSDQGAIRTPVLDAWDRTAG